MALYTTIAALYEAATTPILVKVETGSNESEVERYMQQQGINTVWVEIFKHNAINTFLSAAELLDKDYMDMLKEYNKSHSTTEQMLPLGTRRGLQAAFKAIRLENTGNPALDFKCEHKLQGDIKSTYEDYVRAMQIIINQFTMIFAIHPEVMVQLMSGRAVVTKQHHTVILSLIRGVTDGLAADWVNLQQGQGYDIFRSFVTKYGRHTRLDNVRFVEKLVMDVGNNEIDIQSIQNMYAKTVLYDVQVIDILIVNLLRRVGAKHSQFVLDQLLAKDVDSIDSILEVYNRVLETQLYTNQEEVYEYTDEVQYKCDSAATAHVVKDRALLDAVQSTSRTIYGIGGAIIATEVGTLNCHGMALAQTYFLQGAKSNLLSLPSLIKSDKIRNVVLAKNNSKINFTDDTFLQLDFKRTGWYLSQHASRQVYKKKMRGQRHTSRLTPTQMEDTQDSQE
jgi:hypothetical protein